MYNLSLDAKRASGGDEGGAPQEGVLKFYTDEAPGFQM